jgi:hypothetical protein
MVKTFADALEALAGLYVDRWGRRPTPGELLSCVRYVLAYNPEQYLEGAEGMLLKDLATKPDTE